MNIFKYSSITLSLQWDESSSNPVKRQISTYLILHSLRTHEFWRWEVEGCGWCCDGRIGSSSYWSSKGSKLVIRSSTGSKLPSCNFHSQIYGLASRGLYSIETTPLTSLAKGYCKSQPSNLQGHHTFSHTHKHTCKSSHTNTLTDLSFCFFRLLWFL